ncbi:hypothetical protein [Mucilaginibacter lacusdianchii]|uniref:hypothetical protein n=1 Tax=Mucilaginibacter lacusdianchii TaxID=2684211 RepID=UPI00131B007D|nr:hypothetical protein [Mucilaginibacter sp. JXJ CY 39]
MKANSYLIILFVSLLSLSCKKENHISTALKGSWLLNERVEITIAGLNRYPADLQKPVIITFDNNKNYTASENAQVTVNGSYKVVDDYHDRYYNGKAIFVNNKIIGTYTIRPGKPDTLIIDGAFLGIDASSGAKYVRLK